MNVLKQQLAWIQQQLSQLSASQKMLAGALAALMFVTVLYWGKYAATPDMVVVVDSTFPPEQLGAIQALLRNQGIVASVGADGRVMVAADQQMQAFSAMAWSKMLPANSSQAVDKIVGQMTLWDSAAKTEKLWNEQKEITLGQIIARWPDVEDAQVRIDAADRRSLSLPSEPRAAVNIRLKDGVKSSKAVAVSAAEFLVGSQVGLTRGNVRVAVNGQIVRVGDDDPDGMGSSGEILEQKQNWDRWYIAKLEKALQGFPNPIVTVSVDLDLKKQSSTETTVDPKNIVPLSTLSTEKNEQSTTPGPGGETGAKPNIGTTVDAGAGPATGTQNKESTESNSNAYGHKTTETAQPAGNGTPTSAAVQIPYSYFVEVWKKQNPKAKSEPEDPLLQPVMTAEFDKIRSIVMSSTNIAKKESVTVSAYYDAAPEPVAAAAAGRGGQVMGIVNGHVKEIGLSALALLSLLMVSGIVKRGAAPVAGVTADALAAQKREFENMVNDAAHAAAGTGEEDVASALEGSTALEAMELDDATNQTQQMVQQVTNLVKENPDGAVNLVKRWMNRS